MPNLRNAKKALRQSERRRVRNKAAKEQIAYLFRRVRKALEAQDTDKVKAWLPKALKAVDKAAGKGIMKKNTAARKKSRLMKKVNAFLQSGS